MRTSVPLEKAYLLMNHGPTTLVSASHGGKDNVMAAAWAMPIDFSPPKIAVVIAADTFTRKLVEKSGEFVLSLPTSDQADLTYAVGNTSGAKTDKFKRLGIQTSPGSKVKAPLIEGCAGWLECKVIPEEKNQRDYDLFIAEVLAAWADDELFGPRGWKFKEDGKATIHHVAGGTFAVPNKTIEVKQRK